MSAAGSAIEPQKMSDKTSGPHRTIKRAGLRTNPHPSRYVHLHQGQGGFFTLPYPHDHLHGEPLPAGPQITAVGTTGVWTCVGVYYPIPLLANDESTDDGSKKEQKFFMAHISAHNWNLPPHADGHEYDDVELTEEQGASLIKSIKRNLQLEFDQEFGQGWRPAGGEDGLVMINTIWSWNNPDGVYMRRKLSEVERNRAMGMDEKKMKGKSENEVNNEMSVDGSESAVFSPIDGDEGKDSDTCKTIPVHPPRTVEAPLSGIWIERAVREFFQSDTRDSMSYAGFFKEAARDSIFVFDEEGDDEVERVPRFSAVDYLPEGTGCRWCFSLKGDKWFTHG